MAGPLKLRSGLLAGLPALAVREPAFTTDRPRLYVGSAAGNRLVGLLEKVDALVAPGVNDDSGDGYSRGTRWVDTVTDKVYICADDTVGAAVWKEVPLASGFAELAVENTFTKRQNIEEELADVSSAFPILTLSRKTSGTAADNIGASIYLKAETTNGTAETAAYIHYGWNTAAHATRKGRWSLYVSDAASNRLAINVYSNGGGAQIGFLGIGAPVGQQTGDVAAGLNLFGLFDTSGTYDGTKLTGTVAATLLTGTIAAARIASVVVPASLSATGWADVEATLGSNQNLTQSVYNIIQMATENVDVDGLYNTSTYTFTPATSGDYLVSFGSTVTGAGGARVIAAIMDTAGTPALVYTLADGYIVLAAGTRLVALTGSTGYRFAILPTVAGTVALAGIANTFLKIRRIK